MGVALVAIAGRVAALMELVQTVCVCRIERRR